MNHLTRRFGWEERARWMRFRRARIALWEAPTTAMVVGVVVGRISVSSEGLRTTSRSRRWMSRLGTGQGRFVGWEPVARIRREVSISMSSEESWRWTRTVHWFDDCLCIS